MPSLNHERLTRFQRILEDAGLDCYLACTPISMGYLAGFFESGGERMLLMAIRPKGHPAMVVPALSETHARHTGIEDIRTWNDGEDPGPIADALAEEWSLEAGVIGVDDEMPAGYLLRLQEALPAALFKCAGDEMALLRRRKDAGELALMRRAARIADRALGDILPMDLVGRSEREAAAKLTAGMTDRGGTPTFCIVAAGKNSAEPHHNTSEHAIESGDVLVMDWGCHVGNYLSDITRTVCCGRAPDEAKQVYRVVFKAHMAARASIYPGVACENIDQAAREVIDAAGYGEYFIHRTGHGIGLMGHEPPHMVAGSTSPLEVGQCFSVEPGIYLPGKFGVRIENIVAVTENGHESLNEEPAAELIEIGV